MYEIFAKCLARQLLCKPFFPICMARQAEESGASWPCFSGCGRHVEWLQGILPSRRQMCRFQHVHGMSRRRDRTGT